MLGKFLARNWLISYLVEEGRIYSKLETQPFKADHKLPASKCKNHFRKIASITEQT
jgi:hypothetical protein